jgi:hypothetical protein
LGGGVEGLGRCPRNLFFKVALKQIPVGIYAGGFQTARPSCTPPRMPPSTTPVVSHLASIEGIFCKELSLANGTFFLLPYVFNLHTRAAKALSTSLGFCHTLMHLYRDFILGGRGSVVGGLGEGGGMKEVGRVVGILLPLLLGQLEVALEGGVVDCLGSVKASSQEREFGKMFEPLSLPYVVQHQALDRKLRKIVKNKYRYVRRYVFVRPSDRLRWGIRLIKLCLHLQPHRR